MLSRFTCWGLVLGLLSLTGCSTTPPNVAQSAVDAPPKMPALPSVVVPKPATPAPTVASESRTPGQQRVLDQFTSAHAVYLAEVRVVGGLEHNYISEIWRHDPTLGAAPAIGSEWAPEMVRPARYLGDHVVIYVTAARGRLSSGTTPVTNGLLAGSRLRLEDLHAAVMASRAPAPVPDFTVPHRPELERSIITASEIYLVNVEPADGFVHFRLAEIWRHRAATPPPAQGEEVMAEQSHKVPAAGAVRTAVVFLYTPPSSPSDRWVSNEVRYVINGYVSGRSLFELAQRVKAADAADANAAK